MERELPHPDTSLFDTGTNKYERCGVIVLEDDGTHSIVELPNRSPVKTKHFVVWNMDIHKLVPPDAEIVGVIHTHPFRSSPLPSSDDVAAIPGELIGMVYHPSTTSVSWYDRNGIIEHHQRTKKRR